MIDFHPANIDPPPPAPCCCPEDKPVRVRITPYGIKLAFFHSTETRRPLKVNIPFDQWKQMAGVIGASLETGQRFEGFFGFTPETLALHGIDAVPLPPSSALGAPPEEATLPATAAGSSVEPIPALPSAQECALVEDPGTPAMPIPPASADHCDAPVAPRRRSRAARANTASRSRTAAGKRAATARKPAVRPRAKAAAARTGRAPRVRRKGASAHE